MNNVEVATTEEQDSTTTTEEPKKLNGRRLLKAEREARTVLHQTYREVEDDQKNRYIVRRVGETIAMTDGKKYIVHKDGSLRHATDQQ